VRRLPDAAEASSSDDRPCPDDRSAPNLEGFLTTATVVRSPQTPRSWLAAVSLFAASAAVAVSVTALVIAVDDDTVAPPQSALVAAADEPVVTEYRCDVQAGRTRC
jgi:hypothetical protein